MRLVITEVGAGAVRDDDGDALRQLGHVERVVVRVGSRHGPVEHGRARVGLRVGRVADQRELLLQLRARGVVPELLLDHERRGAAGHRAHVHGVRQVGHGLGVEADAEPDVGGALQRERDAVVEGLSVLRVCEPDVDGDGHALRGDVDVADVVGLCGGGTREERQEGDAQGEAGLHGAELAWLA